jgi:hypothetical protein
MNLINQTEITYEPTSCFDDCGKVFYYDNRVFRAITDDTTARFYSQILQEEWFKHLFDIGLVKTWVNKEFTIDNVSLILEHEKIPYIC